MTYYTQKIEMPATKRDGLSNFVQIIINAIEAGETREALLQAVDLKRDIDCGLYDDALTAAKAMNAAMIEAKRDIAEKVDRATQIGHAAGIAEERARLITALGLA
jgi:hypothetical protein